LASVLSASPTIRAATGAVTTFGKSAIANPFDPNP
jgi:hypothetical protein